MCQHGVNSEQLDVMITMSDDALVTVQKWLEQIHHLADHGQLDDTSASVAQASVLIGEVRAKLDNAINGISEHDHGEHTTVELI